MAQRTEITTICDITGQIADGTVTFSYGGQDYTMDLVQEELDEFRQLMESWISVARVDRSRAAGGRSGRKRTPREVSFSQDTSVRSESAAIRAWAQQDGNFDIGDRGRLSAAVREAYAAAHPAK